MQFIVKKSVLSGEILIPASKSHTLRAVLFGALAKGHSVIRHYLPSPDVASMVDACRLLGASIEMTPEQIRIEGIDGSPVRAQDVIHAGNSGIVLRFCAAVGALAKHPIVLTGDHSIRHQRPMKPLIEALSQLGVSAVSTKGDGYAPVIINGPLNSGKTHIYGADSQPVSALLIASAFADGPVEIEVSNPGELPWIDLTLGWFDRLNIRYENQGYTRYRVPGNSRFEGFEYHVPGDWSSAAFPIAAALITQSEITLKNVEMEDSQGDKEVVNVLRKMGAHIDIDSEAKTLTVRSGCTLKGTDIDLNRFIDAITIFAVIACYAEGETRLYNAAVARQKECDRIHCMAVELGKMGADIVETEDGLIIRQSPLKGARVHSYQDHRMTMSLAVAALGAEGETTVSSVECVSKTFPSFLEHFHSLDANIQGVS